MRHLLHDLRLAGRRLRRAPGFAVLASVTLALGVGAHAALAGWADATFLRPLPVPEPDRLAGIYETRDGGGFHPLSLPDFLDHRERTEAFASLAAHYPVAPLVLDLAGSGDGLQEEILGSVVSPGYFSVLGIEPARGRFFTPDEATPGAAPVAVVSESFQRRRLGGGDGVLGSVVRLNDTAFTVVGVVPDSFRGVQMGEELEVWIPTSTASVGYRWCDAADRDCTFVEMIGRLAEGQTPDEARTEMTVLSHRVRQAHPRPDGETTGLTVAPLVGIHPSARPRALRLAGLLGSAVTLLLLVAAINLGGLLVARNLARRREIATRVAVGAGRWRVVRESIAETAWIAAAGGAGGVLVAALLGRAVVALLPGAGALDLADLPAVAAYGALLSLATGLGVGLAVGLQSSRPDLAATLASRDAAGPSSRWGSRRPRVLGALLVTQVALTFVLLSSAGLLVRSLRNADGLSAVDPARVATLRLRPRLIAAEPERARAFTREALARLEALPGVETATLGRLLPPWSGRDGSSTEPEVVEVGPRYFETFGFPLVRGRGIDEGDSGEGPAVAVVGRGLARARWGESDPVGELLTVGDATYRVIGVVDDTAYRSATQSSPAVVYVPYWRDPSMTDARLAVRTAGEAEELLGALARTVRSVDPAVPVTEVETLTARVDRLLGPTHAAERMIGASALLTLLLSAIGLYGLLSLAVAQARRDIGIRLALGGSRPRIVGGVVRGALGLVALALAIGLVAALGAARGLAHHLYELDPHDPATFAAAVALFALVSAAAAWWPARRAARVDPAVTLRQG